MEVNRALQKEQVDFQATMKADQAEASSDTAQMINAQKESLESFEADKTDETEMQAALRKVETVKKTKDTEKAKKIARVQESILVRKDEADGLASNFSRQNKEYHFDESFLSKIAGKLVNLYEELNQLEDEIRNQVPPLSPQELQTTLKARFSSTIIKFVIEAEPDTPPNTSLEAAQHDKIFDFLIVVVDSKLKSLLTSKESVPPSIVKGMEDLRAHILVAKSEYYASNKLAIDDAHKLVVLGDMLVQGKPEEEARQEIGERIDQLASLMHNPPDFQAFFNNHLQLSHDSIDIYKVYEETSEILEKIGPNLKKANLEPGEMHNFIKGIRVYQAARNLCRISEKQIEQMDRMGADISSITPEKLMTLFFKLTIEARPSPERILQSVKKTLGA